MVEQHDQPVKVSLERHHGAPRVLQRAEQQPNRLRDHVHIRIQDEAPLSHRAARLQLRRPTFVGFLCAPLVVLTLLAAGCGAATTASSAPPPASGGAHALTKITKGTAHFNPIAGVNSDKQAMHQLSWLHVECGWNSGHVWAHGVFKNKLGASVTVNVLPIYRLKNAGQHGDSAGTGSDVKVAAGGRSSWWVDAGAPGGVAGTPRITACRPEIESVSLG